MTVRRQNKQALEAIVEIIIDYFDSGAYENESVIVKSLQGKGDYGAFSIDINEFYGIFWITAADFDSDGYFISLQDAILFAEARFEPYITRFSDERAEQNEGDC